jgi:hypothetical protein
MSRPIAHLAILALAAMLPGAARAAEDVHAVDFRNFVYQPSCADFEAQEEAKVPVRVTGGRFEAAAGSDLEGTYFEIAEVLYGDLEIGKAVHRPIGSTAGAKPIRFAKGTSSGTVTGTTSGIEQYVLQAREGQTMTVRLTSPQKNAAFEILLDDYTVTCRTTEWSGKLPGYGIYRFFVLATRGRASYEMTVGIR